MSITVTEISKITTTLPFLFLLSVYIASETAACTSVLEDRHYDQFNGYKNDTRPSMTFLELEMYQLYRT